MVINFFGRRGSGKTTTIRGNLKYCRPPIIVIDVLGNFHEENFIQCSSIEGALDEIQRYSASASYHRHRNRPGQPIIVVKTGKPDVAADYLSAAIWKLNGGTLILDEVDAIRYKEGSCFDEYIRYGRNHNGDLITGCRRPAELDRNITAAANKFYCFSTHEFRDIEYFTQSVFGERALQLQGMPKFSGLYIDYDKHITGTFVIDPVGNIFHTSEEKLD